MQVRDSRPGQTFITGKTQYAFPAVGEAHWTHTRETFSCPRKLVWACLLYHDAIKSFVFWESLAVSQEWAGRNKHSRVQESVTLKYVRDPMETF